MWRMIRESLAEKGALSTIPQEVRCLGPSSPGSSLCTPGSECERSVQELPGGLWH